ncbi:MAG: hypothetical protein WC457_02925 [Patescibacteria group bacterium]
MPRPDNDFNQEQYTQKVDALVVFKQEFEGKNFDNKICAAIKDSVPLQTEIKSLAWSSIKDKIIWVVAAIIVFISAQFVTCLIPKIADKLTQ